MLKKHKKYLRNQVDLKIIPFIVGYINSDYFSLGGYPATNFSMQVKPPSDKNIKKLIDEFIIEINGYVVNPNLQVLIRREPKLRHDRLHEKIIIGCSLILVEVKND